MSASIYWDKSKEYDNEFKESIMRPLSRIECMLGVEIKKGTFKIVLEMSLGEHK